MRKIAMILLVAGLLLGASECEEETPDQAAEVSEGGGAAGAPAKDGAQTDPSSAEPAKRAEPRDSSTGAGASGSDAATGDSAGDPGLDGGSGEPGSGGERCGSVTCATGQVCCNPSCGICTEPGGACTRQLCEPPAPGPEPRPEPEPELGPFCGGFGGFACPGEGECVDDPRDDCDPENGGADCGGVCECNVQGLCEAGSTWNDAPDVCACEADAASGGGEACGDTTCGEGQVCCNASCGICTPPDGACIQIACP